MTRPAESAEDESAHATNDAPLAPSTLPYWAAAAIAFALVSVGFYGVARDDKNLATLAALGLATLALIGIVSFVFRTLQSIAEPRDEDVLADLAPTEADARKTTALRALKDIDYEHSLGNLSDEDHAELTARYRGEAKQAMRAVDEERKERRARAEALAAEALARAALEEEREDEEEEESDSEEEASAPTDAAADDPSKKRGENAIAVKVEASTCAKCGTVNDADARFCKKCGTVIHEEAS